MYGPIIDSILTSYDLPDDVFDPGETKPTRPKKKVITKKRPHDGGGGGVEVMPPVIAYLARELVQARGSSLLFSALTADNCRYWVLLIKEIMCTGGFSVR